MAIVAELESASALPDMKPPDRQRARVGTLRFLTL